MRQILSLAQTRVTLAAFDSCASKGALAAPPRAAGGYRVGRRRRKKRRGMRTSDFRDDSSRLFCVCWWAAPSSCFGCFFLGSCCRRLCWEPGANPPCPRRSSPVGCWCPSILAPAFPPLALSYPEHAPPHSPESTTEVTAPRSPCPRCCWLCWAADCAIIFC